MVELALQSGNTVAQNIHRPFGGGELALQHHQAEGIAGQLCVQTLTAAGVQHREQSFKAETKIGFTATEDAQRRVRVEIDNTVQRNM